MAGGAGQRAPSRWDAYLGKLREAYLLAKGEVAARQRGRRTRLFDERGVHPFSQAWGEAVQLRAAPDCEPPVIWDTEEGGWTRVLRLAYDQDGDVSSLDLQAAARQDALREFIHDAKEGAFDEAAEADGSALR